MWVHTIKNTSPWGYGRRGARYQTLEQRKQSQASASAGPQKPTLNFEAYQAPPAPHQVRALAHRHESDAKVLILISYIVD